MGLLGSSVSILTYSDMTTSLKKNLEMMPWQTIQLDRQDSQLRKGIVGGDHGREGPIALAESLGPSGSGPVFIMINLDRSWLEKQNHV